MHISASASIIAPKGRRCLPDGRHCHAINSAAKSKPITVLKS